LTQYKGEIIWWKYNYAHNFEECEMLLVVDNCCNCCLRTSTLQIL